MNTMISLNQRELDLVKTALDAMGDRVADREGYSSGEAYWDLKEKISSCSEKAPAEKIQIYALSVVSSEGFVNGNDSNVSVYPSLRECIDGAYELYASNWGVMEENGDITEWQDSNGSPFMSKDEFEAEFIQGSVCIQMNDWHISFEFFQKDLELSRDQEIANTPEKHSLDSIIRAAEANSKTNTPSHSPELER